MQKSQVKEGGQLLAVRYQNKSVIQKKALFNVVAED